MRRIHFVVQGRVQGVAFRAHTRSAAARLGVVGFVQNRADGAVIGEAEGEPAAVAAFVAWLHEGSPWSRVDTVGVTELPATRHDAAFDVRR
ncbi:MAG: acylphosphatase [Planctomycetota bacterium]